MPKMDPPGMKLGKNTSVCGIFRKFVCTLERLILHFNMTLMKNCFTLRIVAGLFAASLLFGCGDKSSTEPGPNPGPNPGPEPPQTPLFELTTPSLTFDSSIVTVKCSDANMTFYCGLTSKKNFELSASDDAYITAELATMQAYAEEEGVTLQDFLGQALQTLAANVTATQTLDADQDYYVYAYGLDVNGKVLSKMTKLLIHTPVADPVVAENCTFNFDLLDQSATSYSIVVYPSDLTVEYYCAAIPNDTYILYGGTPEGIKQFLIDSFTEEAKNRNVSFGKIARDNCMRGNQLFGEYAGVDSDTDFIALAIGMDSQGRFTTDAGVFEFSTLPQDQSTASVTLEFSKYYDGTALADADPTKYETARGKAFMPVTIAPDAFAVSWKLYAGTKRTLGTLPLDILYDLIDQKGTADQTNMKLACAWDEYIIVAAAKDDAGLWGPMIKQEIAFVKENVSPIADIISAPNIARSSIPVISSVLEPVQPKFQGRQGNFVPNTAASRLMLLSRVPGDLK